MDSISGRLRSERERLGLTQDDFAQKGGVQRRAQANYETGDRSPDAAYLAGIAAAGVDVGYVITGIHTTSQELIQEELQNLSAAWQAIDEALVNAKKTMPSDKKRLAAEAIYNAVKADGGVAKPLAELLTKAA